jgi:hypothetical protein
MGRDFATGDLLPVYSWNNTNTSNGAKVDGVNEAGTTYIKDNRDYFNAVSASAQSSPTSPFNGTVGMGFGTVANRPTTCTHSNPTNPTRSPEDDGKGGVGYFATDAGAGHVRLTWTASTDNVGVTGYKIYRNSSLIGTSATNSYTDDTASPSTSYNYTVSAYDAAGNESAQSSSKAVTTTVMSGLGILYRCGTTNDWVTHYAPYTYPHPLTQ